MFLSFNWFAELTKLAELTDKVSGSIFLLLKHPHIHMAAQEDDPKYVIVLGTKVFLDLPDRPDRTHETVKNRIKQHKAFLDWLRAILAVDSWSVSSVTLHAMHFFGRELRDGFVNASAVVRDEAGELSTAVTLIRGPAVAVLVILRCVSTKERYVALVEQDRVASGQKSLLELPAGMLDGSSDFVGAAAKEMREELQLILCAADLKPLSEHGLFSSPGGCDEAITFFYHEAEYSEIELEQLQGRCTGNRQEGEKMRVRLVRFDDLLSGKTGILDMKVIFCFILFVLRSCCLIL